MGLALVAVVAACGDGSAPAEPVPPPPNVQLITCQADVRAGRLSCDPATADPAGPISAEVVLGGQGVKMRSANVSYNASTEVFQADVTVQNLGGLNQPYFLYHEILEAAQVSAAETWKWAVPSTVATFRFQVLVQAAAIEPLSLSVSGRLERGTVVLLHASGAEGPVPDNVVTWSADPPAAVEFVDAGRAHFLAAGEITVTARVPGAPGAAVSGAVGHIALEVAVPPTIVFDLLRDGNRDIYRAALDGADLVRLTTNPGDDVEPTVAGNTVVFVSYRDGRGALYATSLAGGADHRLAVVADPESQPALSPDGRRLAHVRTESGVPKLWLADADGGNAARATGGFGFSGSVEGSPSWAPAADRLAFFSTARGTAGLFQLLVTTGGISPLTDDTSPDVEPAWSPDGGRIAFASPRNGATSVYLLDLNSRGVSRLSPGPGTDGEPAWLGDGRLVYVNWSNGVPRLCWLDPAAPDSVHVIDVGPGAAAHPKGVL